MNNNFPLPWPSPAEGGRGDLCMPIPSWILHLRKYVGHARLLVPAVSAAVFNRKGEILLVKRKDTLMWALPGGTMEPRRSPRSILRQELNEEAGVAVRIRRLIGVYSVLSSYPNGDKVHLITNLFLCAHLRGVPRPDHEETVAAQFFPPAKLPRPFSPHHRRRIRDALRLLNHDPIGS